MPTIAPQTKPSRMSSSSSRAIEISSTIPSALYSSSTNGALIAAPQSIVNCGSPVSLKMSSISGVLVYSESVVATTPPHSSAASRMLRGSRSYVSR